MPPIFSVIIPAYNQAEFLTEAVQSILAQTVQDFEVLIVNDASTDHTDEVIAQFDDPRVIALTHSENRGLPAARNTGMAAAQGEFIALLDADDYFDPRKFEAHLQFLRLHPEISVTYNARYQLHFSSQKIRDIYRPPATTSLSDFVLGFPFSPSDMVIRRETAARVGFFDAGMRCGGEDVDFPCRLALEGFLFARVEGVLNHRRFHAGRRRKKLRCRFGDYTRALDRTFQDPRCPESVLALRNPAYANHYSEVLCWALAQGESDLAGEILQEILLLEPAILSGSSSRLAKALFNFSIRDDTQDHEKLLATLFSALPKAWTISSQELNRLAARGYLLKGTRSALWGDEVAASRYFEQAGLRQADLDEAYRAQLVAQLANYEDLLGRSTAEAQADRLFPYLERLAGKPYVRRLQGQIAINRAFALHDAGRHSLALREVARAVVADPANLSNRGVLSLVAHALIRLPSRK